ncbi:MAG: argonaute/piwi family protein, partial [Terriglobia bacterium]
MILRESPLEVVHFLEPELEFAFKQKTPHPKDGLFLYGPHGKDHKIRDIQIGVVGTNDGIKYFRAVAAEIKKRIAVPPPGKGEKKDRLHLANFPGIAEAFGISFNENELVTCTLDAKAIADASIILNHHEAVRKVAELYLRRIRKYHENEERAIDVWILIVPEIVFERCRPGSKRTGLPMLRGDFGKRQRLRSNLPLLGDLVDHAAEEIFDDVPDFHRQVKAGLLNLIPSQVLRETTLAPDQFKNAAGYPTRRLQERATVAWNLSTGLYYKTQPSPPWKLAGVRPGVCYIG